MGERLRNLSALPGLVTRCGRGTARAPFFANEIPLPLSILRCAEANGRLRRTHRPTRLRVANGKAVVAETI